MSYVDEMLVPGFGRRGSGQGTSDGALTCSSPARSCYVPHVHESAACIMATHHRHVLVPQWDDAAARRLDAIMAAMWDPQQHCWCDLLLHDKGGNKAGPDAFAVERIASQHAASWTPLLWGALDRDSNDERRSACVAAMETSGLVQAAGLCTTLLNTDQQWDGANCWPPLLCSWVDGLMQHGGPQGQLLARRLGCCYLRSVAQGLLDTGVVWEKFNALRMGAVGTGGEYQPQRGFGWSNGTALHLIVRLHLTL
jgi:alpha,alpha-trehalase